MFISLLRLKGYRSDDESREGTSTGDLAVDFDQKASQTENEEDENVGLPLELERIIAQEDREMRPHQEETKLEDLGTGRGRKEVKIGMGMIATIREELMALLKNYQDIFA